MITVKSFKTDFLTERTFVIWLEFSKAGGIDFVYSEEHDNKLGIKRQNLYTGGRLVYGTGVKKDSSFELYNYICREAETKTIPILNILQDKTTCLK